MYKSGFIFTNKSPFLTTCPSLTGKEMISPDTSEDIFTSISGWILPVAETVSTTVISFTVAISTSVPFSFLPITPVLDSINKTAISATAEPNKI